MSKFIRKFDFCLKYNLHILKTPSYLLLIIIIVILFLFPSKSFLQTNVIDSLRIELNKQNIPDTLKLNILNRMILRWNLLQKDSALVYINIYKGLAIKNNRQKDLSRVAYFESIRYLEEGNFAEAKIAAFKRIQIALTNKFTYIVADSYSDLGNIYLKAGDLDSALFYYNKGVEVSIEGAKTQGNKLKTTEARNKINVSEIYKLKGDFVKALEIAQEALAICKKHNLTGFLASNYNLFGEVYMEVKDYPKAKINFLEAIANSNKTNNLNKLSITYELLAECEVYEKNYSEAEKHLASSLQLGRQSKIPSIEGRALWKLANLYHIMGLNDKASIAIDKSSKLLSDNKDNLELINAMRVKGEIFISAGKYKAAKEACMKAKSLNSITGQKGDEMKICHCLYEACKGTNEHNLALNHLECYLSLKDSLMNFTISRKITQLEYQKFYNEKTLNDSLLSIRKFAAQTFVYEKEKGRQNLLLTVIIFISFIILISLIFFAVLYFSNKKKNYLLEEKGKLIKKQKISIETSLLQKEVLLKEIHHRVKNNLQIISGLLELQYNSLEDKKQGTALLEGQSRVKSMALIHQKLYQTEDLAFVNLKDYLNELIDYLRGVFFCKSAVRIEMHIEEITLDIDTAVPLGLIMNEMISNSFKYAVDNKENLIININISTIQPGEYQLILKDNGPGIPVGFDILNSQSLGLKLIKRLTQQLFGSFKFLNDNGLTIVLTFKDTALRKEVD